MQAVANGRHHAIAAFPRKPDKHPVHFNSIIDALSARAPAIVVWALGIALLCPWFGVPLWAVTALAVAIGGLALLLFAARGGRHSRRVVNHNRNWLAWEVAGQGTPPGFYLLAAGSFLTLFLIGFGSDYARPAWASLALAIAWGIANRQYPADEEEESR